MRTLMIIAGLCVAAGLCSAAYADRTISRTLEEGLERQTMLTLETTHFDASFDVLNYRSKLGSGAAPEGASIHTLDLSLPISPRWSISYSYRDSSGEASRTTQPISVTTRIESHLIEAGFDGWSIGSWTGRGFVGLEQGDQDPLSIDCYARAGIILGGSCDEATLRFFDPEVFRETGETVYLPVLTSKAEQRSMMVGASLAKSAASWRMVHHLHASQARIDVNFNSPLFDITDPFILGASFQGQAVGEIISKLRAELPQTRPWIERALAYEFSAMRPMGSRITGLAKFRAIKIWRDDYDPGLTVDDVTTNAALDLSLWFTLTPSVSTYVRAEAFMHYLAGFEPLAYNRKTARLFEHPYGQLSVGVVIAFP